MAEIKSYKPENRSLSTGQVLKEPYDFERTKLIVKEMTDLLVLDLVSKQVVTNQIVLNIGYDIINLQDNERAREYKGEVTLDHYGRPVPKPAHGSINLDEYSSSTKVIMNAALELFERVADPALDVRRLNVVAANVISEKEWEKRKLENDSFVQLDFFSDFDEKAKMKEINEKEMKREKSMQNAILDLRKKFGKNAVLKGMNLSEGGTTIERNGQIGGHRA